MNNTITFTITATPENTDLISNITALMTGGKPTKQVETTTKAKPTTTKAKPEVEEATGPTITEFKAAIKKAKAKNDEAFVMQTIEEAGVTVGETLGRTVSKVKAEQYQDIMDTLAEGPVITETSSDDELDDDELDDNEPPEVDAETVKLALKAYSKEHGRAKAKELMNDFKCPALSSVDKLSQAKLAELMGELM